MSQVDLLEEVHHLRFTPDRDLLNAFHAYRVSEITRLMGSEVDREIYAEALLLEPEVAGSKTFYPQTLAALAVQSLAKSFNGGPVPDGLDCEQRREFGLLLDVEHPVLKLLEIDNETYWKRVVKAKTKALVHFMEMDRDRGTYWKPRGIELKVAEAVGLEPPEYWFEGPLEEILIKTASFVSSLLVTQLQPLRKVEPAEGYEQYKLYNVPAELCNHGSLKILRHLENLTSLQLVFGLGDVVRGYERRFFEFSLEDVENFVEGLDKLPLLRHFTITKSHLTTDKLKILMKHLAIRELETLDMSHCYMSENCGILLGKYISKCPATLKDVNLAGNLLTGKEIEDFGYGINVFEGTLRRLDLSHNPIGEAGILMLGGAVKNTRHLRELIVTACDIGEMGAFRVVQLLGFHEPLRVVHMHCTPLGIEGGAKLIEVLKENWFIEEVGCKFCELKERQERRIKQFLRRNKKFLESRAENSLTSAVTSESSGQ